METEEAATEDASVESNSVVTIENYRREVTFEGVPQRFIVTNEHTTEIMLALGLEKHIAGVIRREGRYVLPEYEAAFDKLPLLGNENPSLELVLNLNPDLIYGRESSFAGNTPIESVENLEKYGIKVFVDTDSYSENSTIDMLYQDIMNLGLIFQVEERAAGLVHALKEKAEMITSALNPAKEEVRVLVFDSGGDNVFTAGNWALQTRLIEMAGGENIFSDIEKNWADVSWEEVVRRDPQVIVINNYGTNTADEKIKEITNRASLKDVSAVQDKRFVIIPLDSVFAGVQNMNALEAMAKAFHPESFK
ncbi:hypothetical protein BK138_30080 [Paenibacillus rhizosphaerae]|uniref:Fe/B12 periplasmic-binding domain-containing protein n=1 Tax=Paenibacillus rhizosphaerae TaxID=297318 RepID=A0A1R1EC88_9BACL|nr:ABC transporter substrate-binding protein [Paenibacillus rhizosphaerae]OMF49443.1 hypothetical protein BK138_30080 [Paenibacillus rhizosphaerae]